MPRALLRSNSWHVPYGVDILLQITTSWKRRRKLAHLTTPENTVGDVYCVLIAVGLVDSPSRRVHISVIEHRGARCGERKGRRPGRQIGTASPCLRSSRRRAFALRSCLDCFQREARLNGSQLGAFCAPSLSPLFLSGTLCNPLSSAGDCFYR